MNDADLNPPERREFTEAELKEARHEVIEDIVTQGKELGDWSLADFLDLEIDDNGRSFAERLATINGGLYREGPACFVMALDQFYRQIVEKYLPEDLVMERAEENERERKENA